ncbi:hypothetical protein [Aurantivibrio infirmus]
MPVTLFRDKAFGLALEEGLLLGFATIKDLQAKSCVEILIFAGYWTLILF